MRIIVLSFFVVLAIAGALLSIAFAQRTDASGGGPEMTLRVEGEGVVCAPGDEMERCTIPRSSPFVLTVDLAQPPVAGFVEVRTALDVGSVLAYLPRPTKVDEIVWKDCVVGAKVTKLRKPPVLLHGCLSSLLPPYPAVFFIGPLIEIDLECSPEDSTTLVELLPFGHPDAGVDGSLFLLPDGITQVVPKVDSVEVACAGEPLATFTPMNTAPPTATYTLTPTPSPTPTPVALAGDVDGDGDVTSLDAALILQYVAGQLGSVAANADVNADGAVDSRDAALVLQYVAGLIGYLPP